MTTTTDLILAVNNFLDDPRIDDDDPVLAEHVTKIRQAVDGIPLIERLRMALEAETGMPMAYGGTQIAGENGPPPPPEYRPDPPPAPPVLARYLPIEITGGTT